MLNYKTLTIILLMALALLVLSYAFFHVAFIYLIALVALSYISLLGYGSSNIRSGFYVKALCSVKTNEKLIALSFDDGPTAVTPEILDVLKEYNVHAAFFVIGNRIAGNEEVLKRINEDEHLIGNHSFTHHFWFDFFSKRKMIEELKKTEEIIKNITLKKVRLFRPPYGVTNPRLKKAIAAMNYVTIGWSLKSKDTVLKREDEILNRITKNLKPGYVVLFHDTNKRTIRVLKAFIEFALQNNYRIVRLDKLFNIQAYERKIG